MVQIKHLMEPAFHSYSTPETMTKLPIRHETSKHQTIYISRSVSVAHDQAVPGSVHEKKLHKSVSFFEWRKLIVRLQKQLFKNEKWEWDSFVKLNCLETNALKNFRLGNVYLQRRAAPKLHKNLPCFDAIEWLLMGIEMKMSSCVSFLETWSENLQKKITKLNCFSCSN